MTFREYTDGLRQAYEGELVGDTSSTESTHNQLRWHVFTAHGTGYDLLSSVVFPARSMCASGRITAWSATGRLLRGARDATARA